MAGNSEESGEIVSKPRVSVRTLSGRTYHFDVQETTTVEELKRMIQTELDIPVEIQRLLFQGRILQDGQTLKEVHCFNKVVHLVKRAQPPPNTTPTPTAPTMNANVSSATTDTPSQPSTTTPASGVMFSNIPPSFIGAATQQMFNDMWQSFNSAAVNTSTSDTATPPTSGAATSAPQAGAQEANSRAATLMLVHTRQLLLHCQKILDRFDRGESISTQDVAHPVLQSSGPTISAGAPLLGELYQQLAAIHERLQPLLREQARFLSEDLALDEQEQERVERRFTCLRGVLDSVNLCDKGLASLSVSSSQPPPRTVQLPARTNRSHHLVIGTPHVARVQVNISQTNVTPPTPTTTTGSAPPQPPPQPQLPGDIANIIAQTLNSFLPEGAPPVDLSAQGANPPTVPGEAVFIQNDIAFGLGPNFVPPLPHAGIPMNLTVLQLARMMNPRLDHESEDDLSSQLMGLLCGLVTVNQLRDIGQGRVECLQAMYPRIREFVLTKLLPEEGNRGVEDQGRAARRLAVSAGDENLDGLVNAIPTQVEVDLKETFINFLYLNLKSAIALVLDPRNQEPESSQAENRFGKVIWGWGHNMFCEILQLVDVMARAGNTDVHAVIEAYFLSFFDSPTQPEVAVLPINPLIIVLRENRDKIDSIIRNSRLSSEQIKEKYFVHKRQAPSPPALPIVPTWLSEEWKQCLEEDKAMMGEGGPPSICFSNSYMSLSGLSAEKGETVSCSAEDMLCETLTMSINTSQVAPATSMEEVVRDVRQSSSLKKRYSDFIDSNLKKRLRSDPNFSGERFPNAADKFNP